MRVRRRILRFSLSMDVVGPGLDAMALGEREVSQGVQFDVLEHAGRRRAERLEFPDRLVIEGAHQRRVRLLEYGRHDGGALPPCLPTPDLGGHVALHVHDAALSGGLGVDLRDGLAQALVSIGDHEPDVSHASLLQIQQKPRHDAWLSAFAQVNPRKCP